MAYKQNLQTRFWSKVEKSDGCWVWRGDIGHGGYGRIRINGANKMSHRIAWEWVNGPIPAGLVICHSCDNPPCVNPDHLRAATQKENVEESERKGRRNYRTGPAPWRAKLTEENVREMRHLHKENSKYYTDGKIAKMFGVDPSTAKKAIYGLTWKHVNQQENS